MRIKEKSLKLIHQPKNTGQSSEITKETSMEKDYWSGKCLVLEERMYVCTGMPKWAHTCTCFYQSTKRSVLYQGAIRCNERTGHHFNRGAQRE